MTDNGLLKLQAKTLGTPSKNNARLSVGPYVCARHCPPTPEGMLKSMLSQTKAEQSTQSLYAQAAALQATTLTSWPKRAEFSDVSAALQTLRSDSFSAQAGKGRMSALPTMMSTVFFRRTHTLSCT